MRVPIGDLDEKAPLENKKKKLPNCVVKKKKNLKKGSKNLPETGALRPKKWNRASSLIDVCAKRIGRF